MEINSDLDRVPVKYFKHMEGYSELFENTMRALYTFILALLSPFTNAQGIYEYKTLLKGGYRILLMVDKDQHSRLTLTLFYF